MMFITKRFLKFSASNTSFYKSVTNSRSTIGENEQLKINLCSFHLLPTFHFNKLQNGNYLYNFDVGQTS